MNLAPSALPSSVPLLKQISLILAVKGVEYKTIAQFFLKEAPPVQILAIPTGLNPVKSFLNQEFSSIVDQNLLPRGVLLMGLGGGLSSHLSVGQIVVYQGCGYVSEAGKWQYLDCDLELTQKLADALGGDCLLSKGISVDRVITQAQAKKALGQKYAVDIVDMEGYAVLDFFQRRGIPVTILRIISDDCQQNLPDLSDIFDQKGEMMPWIVSRQLLKSPLASLRLIRHALSALRELKAIAQRLS